MMKKISLLMISCFCILIICNAQPHQAFKYQAIVRNAGGEIISNQTVGVQVSIRNNDAAGPVVYQETHSATTSEFGLINLIIGEGTPGYSYDFENVDWSDQFKFIEIEIDPAGGTNYISLGVSELLSVPYVLYSERSMDSYWENTSNNIYFNPGNVGIGTTDPLNKLEVNGTTLIGTSTKGIRFRTNGAIADIESLGTDLAINYQGFGNTVLNVDAGYVGIGYLSPTYLLHVKHSVSNSWITSIDNTSTSANGHGLTVREYGGIPFSVQNLDGSVFVVKQSGYVGIGTYNPNSLFEIISPGYGDVMRVSNSSNVPLAKFREEWEGSGALYLNDNTNATKVLISAAANSYINSGSLGLGTTSPANAKLQIEGTGTYDGILKLNNTGTYGAEFFIGSTNSAWGGGTNQNLFVMGHGATSSANIDIVINEFGNVGIATTAPTQMLDVNGRGRFRLITTGAINNAVYQAADGTLISGSSDIRLKENIEPLHGSLEKVNQLQGVSFTWKADPGQGKSIGFIAQEFEKVVPELVFTNQTDGYKGINYAEVTALLTEAIKEQQKIIETLKTRIEALENNRPE
jgi:hypothetical protein